MPLHIRAAGIEDAVMIADLSHRTFYDTFAASNKEEDMRKFLGEQFTKGKLMLEVGRKENHFYLAYEGEELAGYLKLRDGQLPAALHRQQALEIARLYACSAFIGKGVGAALMQKSIDVAKELNKDWVWLGVWEKNERAIDFYRRWGFEKFADSDFLLGNDLQNDWLMRRPVSL